MSIIEISFEDFTVIWPGFSISTGSRERVFSHNLEEVLEYLLSGSDKVFAEAIRCIRTLFLLFLN